MRAYGFPGRRQTRWIQGVHQLSVEEVRSGHVSTTRWRGRRGQWNCTTVRDGYVWEMFPADHVHYVPLRSLLPPGAHNLVAAGRCVDGDAAALSSVRVMGPCSAMGFAAAHVLEMAAKQSTRPFRGTDFDSLASVHSTDSELLRSRLAANLGAPGNSGGS